MTTEDARFQRERDHWDHVIPTADEVVAEYRRGPDPNTALMLDSVASGPGKRVIDFACGGGVTSLWLAAQGTEVTGVDLSPRSIEVANAAAHQVGLDVKFVVANLEDHEIGTGYDGMVGRYALHHLDVAAIAPAMAAAISVGARAAFVETMARNPVLRLARKRLTGRFGIPRYGTLDEHPLVQADLDALEHAFGSLRSDTRRYEFLSLVDRQLLRYRSPRAGALLGAADAQLRRLPVVKDWSYHQVLVATRTS